MLSLGVKIFYNERILLEINLTFIVKDHIICPLSDCSINYSVLYITIFRASVGVDRKQV